MRIVVHLIATGFQFPPGDADRIHADFAKLFTLICDCQRKDRRDQRGIKSNFKLYHFLDPQSR